MDERPPRRDSGRPSSGRPSSRPSSSSSSSASGRPSSSRPSSSSSRPMGPNGERRREDLPARGGSSGRAGATRQVSQGREASDPRGFRPKPLDRDQSRLRPRIFEPDIPEEITGEELEKSVRAELLSLSAENAKVVARH